MGVRYRRLGKTELVVSVIGMGTWQFGGEWGKTFAQDEVDRMFSKAKDLGINLELDHGVVERLRAGGYRLRGIDQRQENLESIFLRLTTAVN